jgi:YebC/PmpR family DNA-binding regulatory protein
MSGHSKWSTIKHKKAKEDAKRGKQFTKLIKEITVAARMGGGDPEGNPRLRLLMDKAKEINMPMENSQRAIKRGTGELPGVSYERYLYEGYGPSNSAVIIDVLTDNKNRAIAELRALFARKGGTIAESGAVSWMFDKLGVIRIPNQGMTEDQLIENLLAHDVKDVYSEDGTFVVTCDMKALDEIKQALALQKIAVESADVEWVPKTILDLDTASEEKVYDFLSGIEDLEDVQNVYTNIG